MKFSVRIANAADAEQIASVHYKAWIETYTGLLPEGYLATRSVEKSIKLFKTANCNNIVVACDADLIIGFCGWGQFREPVQQESIGEIQGIYLLDEYKHQHIGQMMIEYAMEQLKNAGYNKVGLWVLDTNKNAIGFYEKIGFKYINIIKEVNLGYKITELLYVKEL